MLLKNNLMYINQLFVVLLISSFVISCATDSDTKETINLEGRWELEGLEELEINNINEKTSPVLFSTSNGIYSKNENGFVEFGLQDKEVIEVVEITQSEYLAATQSSDFGGGDTTIFKKQNNVWSSFMGNFGGEDGNYTWIGALEVSPHNGETILIGGGGNIVKSINAGQSWKSVYYDWGTIGFTNFITFAQTNTNLVYAGGENAIFEPTLIKSEDGGDSWDRKNIYNNIEAVNNDLIINQKDVKNLLIGLSGSFVEANVIRKSTDSGETWNTVFEGAGIYTFTQSASNSDIVYASGRNPTGHLFFLASNDFGDTWQTLEYPESPSGIYVNDMVSIMEDGEEVIYLGTNKGLYSFTVE